MTTAREAVDQVVAAAGSLTAALGLANPDARLADLAPVIEVLERALGRVRVTLALDPEALLHDELPATYFTPQDEADRILVEDFLEQVIAASEPDVQLVAHADGAVHVLGIAEVKAVAGARQVDITHVLPALQWTVEAAADEDGDEDPEMAVPPTLAELRSRMGMRRPADDE